jgi:hypothetical protein
MSFSLWTSGPANAERYAKDSHSDHERAERWRDYSVAFGNENGPLASVPHGTGHGLGPSPVYGQSGWSLHGLSRG